MDTLVSYLLRLVLVSGLMLGYYHLALRNRKLHAFNRAWLLTALLASLALPLVHLDWLTWHTAARPTVVLAIGKDTNPAAAAGFPTVAVMVGVSAAVSAVLLAILGFRVLRVYRLKRGHRPQKVEGCLLIEVRDRRAPFSFLKNLFWQEGADIRDPFNRKVLDHELAHIRGGHTYDTLFAQALSAIFWMNPFFWLIRRELQMVHEFIADDVSITSGDTETFALMLLRAYDGGRYLDPSHSFYFSPIKRRLRMISSSTSPSRWRMALALPILLAVVALACSKEQQAPGPVIKPDQPDLVKQLKFSQLAKQFKISRDSLQLAFAPAVKRILITGIAKAIRDGKGPHITLDTLEFKGKLDLSQAVEITGMDSKTPPPPPPARN
jgi:hypothetical protein